MSLVGRQFPNVTIDAISEMGDNLRINILDEAIKKDKKIANEEHAIAEEKFRIAKANAERSANDAAVNDALAEAEANVYKARKAHSDKTKELNAQRVEAINAMKAEEKAADKSQ